MGRWILIPEGRIGHHMKYNLLLTPIYISSKRTRSDSMNPSLACFQNARRRSRKVDGFAAQCSRNQKCVFLPLHLDHCSYIDLCQICILAHVVRNSPSLSLLFNFPLNTSIGSWQNFSHGFTHCDKWHHLAQARRQNPISGFSP